MTPSTIECAHHEDIKWKDHHQVGICRHCGQVRQYPREGYGNIIILRKGGPSKARVIKEVPVKALAEQIPIPKEQKEEKETMVDEKRVTTRSKSWYDERLVDILKDKES